MKSIVTQNCIYCNTQFQARTIDINKGHAKFCSRSCSQSHRRLTHTPNTPNTECALCGTAIYRKPSQQKASRSGLVFCSRSCKEKAQTVGTEHSISAIHLPHYGDRESKHHYRLRAFQEHGAKCIICGYDKYPDVLHVHHKDRNRDNGALNNLEVLCPTHHYENHYLAKDGWFR